MMKETLSEQNLASIVANNSVYADSIFSSKLNCLKDTFPVTANLLGENYFRQCAKYYIDQHTMTHQDLNLFGEEFHLTMAALVEEKNELQKHDYLAELALFEWMLHQTYYQGNSEKLFRMVAKYNVKDLWQAHQADDIDAALENFTLTEGEFRYQFN